MKIDDVINELKKLDLSTYPENEIRNLISKFGIIASMGVNYHPGKSVMRARPHDEGVRFKLKKDLSFKPQEYNKTYQRASTPYETMFYATAVPDEPKPGELDNMRVIGIAETIPMMRDLTKSGFQKVSFGMWYVKEPLTLLAIVHKDSYYNENSFTKELVEAYKEASKSASPELIEKSLKIQTFLADEFSKEHLRYDYDYMISAIFTQMVVNKGFDGVFYPSVRVGGRGFNIAITPAATKKLGLYVAGECSVYKKKDNTIVDNNAVIQLDGSQETFEMKDLQSNEKIILLKLGINSKDELKNYA